MERQHIARLLPDGTLDPAWNPQANGVVRALAVNGAGDIFLGGNFSVVGGLVRLGIAKLSGGASAAVDAVWDPAANAPVFALAIGAGDDLYVGRGFIGIGGEQRAFIAKLKGTGLGVADAQWNPSADNAVLAFGVDDAGSVFVGGAFTNIGGQSRASVAKLSATGDGAADPAWSQPTNGWIETLVLDGEGHVFVGGAFTTIGGVPRDNMAKLSTSGRGQADAVWDPSPDRPVFALVLHGGGALYAGGFFTSIGGLSRNNIAALSRTGTGLADLQWNPSANATVSRLRTSSTGAIYAAGQFTSIGGQPRNRLAALPPVQLPDSIFADGFEAR